MVLKLKKSLGVKNPSKIPSDEEFINSYRGRPRRKKVKELINFFNDFKENRKTIEGVIANKTPKYLNFSVSTNQKHKISISLHLNPEYESGGIQFWCPKEIEQPAKKIIREILPKSRDIKRNEHYIWKNCQMEIKGLFDRHIR